MSEQIVGNLTKIGEKAWNGKVLFSLFVRPDGASQDVMIGLGLEKPPVQPPCRVKIIAEKNNKGYLVTKAHQVELLKDEPAPAPSSSSGGKSTGFIDRQASIVLQSSYKTGVDMANALLSSGLFKPAANTKSAKETAIESYLALVDQLAVSLYTKCMEPDKFLDEFIADAQGSPSGVQANEAEGRPFEDELPDF